MLGLPLYYTTCCTGSGLLQVQLVEREKGEKKKKRKKRSGCQSCYAVFKCSQALKGVAAQILRVFYSQLKILYAGFFFSLFKAAYNKLAPEW